MLANVNTWSAYNVWGGGSNYTWVSADKRLSFLRPNPPAALWSHADDLRDNGQHATGTRPGSHLTRAELWAQGWLRSAGYQFDLFTDIDFHCGIERLGEYRAILLAGHPEYWSVQMRDQLADYLDAGGHLLYLGGTGLYRRVDYTADLTAIAHIRNDPLRDSLSDSSGHLDAFPELQLLGVQDLREGHDVLFGEAAPYEIVDALHPFTRGLPVGTRVTGREGLNGAASGWEVDRSAPVEGEPVWIRRDGHLKVIGTGAHAELRPNNLVQLTRPSGGWTLAAGSINFAGALALDPALQRIVSNALDAALAS